MIKCNKTNRHCITCPGWDKCVRLVSKAYAGLVLKDMDIK